MTKPYAILAFPVGAEHPNRTNYEYNVAEGYGALLEITPEVFFHWMLNVKRMSVARNTTSETNAWSIFTAELYEAYAVESITENYVSLGDELFDGPFYMDVVEARKGYCLSPVLARFATDGEVTSTWWESQFSMPSQGYQTGETTRPFYHPAHTGEETYIDSEANTTVEPLDFGEGYGSMFLGGLLQLFHRREGETDKFYIYYPASRVSGDTTITNTVTASKESIRFISQTSVDDYLGSNTEEDTTYTTTETFL